MKSDRCELSQSSLTQSVMGDPSPGQELQAFLRSLYSPVDDKFLQILDYHLAADGNLEELFLSKYNQKSHAALEPMTESTISGVSLQRLKKASVSAIRAFMFSKSSQCVTSLRK